MGYACRVERDSMSPDGVHLTSFVITFPRAVLAEVKGFECKISQAAEQMLGRQSIGGVQTLVLE